MPEVEVMTSRARCVGLWIVCRGGNACVVKGREERQGTDCKQRDRKKRTKAKIIHAVTKNHEL